MMFPLFLGITLITFAVIHLAPGEPVEMQTAMNPKVTAEARERMRKFYGLDKPLHVQYCLGEDAGPARFRPFFCSR